MATYMDRFLNIPEARLPGELGDLEDLPKEPEALLEQILSLLDHRQNLNAVTSTVARYVRLGLPRDDLIDTLAIATLREDLDFHKIQVLEAGGAPSQTLEGSAGGGGHLRRDCSPSRCPLPHSTWRIPNDSDRRPPSARGRDL